METENVTCAHCGINCSPRYFDISRNIERVHHKSPVTPDEIEVGDSQTIGLFCSKFCVDSGRAEVMSRERVPITRPTSTPSKAVPFVAGP
jgi:hypothetical protein